MSVERSVEATYHRDVLDIILEGSKKTEIVDIKGEKQIADLQDHESIYWMTRSVNASTFSRLVLCLGKLKRLAMDAENHMSVERASSIKKSLLEIIQEYKYSIDAKASESVASSFKGTPQSTLIDKLTQHKTERAITVNEKVKAGFVKSLMGKDDDD